MKKDAKIKVGRGWAWLDVRNGNTLTGYSGTDKNAMVATRSFLCVSASSKITPVIICDLPRWRKLMALERKYGRMSDAKPISTLGESPNAGELTRYHDTVRVRLPNECDKQSGQAITRGVATRLHQR